MTILAVGICGCGVGTASTGSKTGGVSASQVQFLNKIGGPTTGTFLNHAAATHPRDLISIGKISCQLLSLGGPKRAVHTLTSGIRGASLPDETFTPAQAETLLSAATSTLCPQDKKYLHGSPSEIQKAKP